MRDSRFKIAVDGERGKRSTIFDTKPKRFAFCWQRIGKSGEFCRNPFLKESSEAPVIRTEARMQTGDITDAARSITLGSTVICGEN